MINLTDWIAVIPPEDKQIAYVGEHESVTRQFFLSDLTYRDYAFFLDMEFDLSTVTHTLSPRTVQSTQHSSTEKVDADGITVISTANTTKESYTREGMAVECEACTDIAPLAKSVREDGILLTWTVLSQQTQLPGSLRATLRAVGPNGEIKKSAMMLFTVSSAVEASPASPIPLSEHEQMERAMELALEQAAADTYSAIEQTAADTRTAIEQTAADTYAAFEKDLSAAVGSVEEVKAYVDDKTAPAVIGTTGTIKLGRMSTGYYNTPDGFVLKKGTGLGLNADGELAIAPASLQQFKNPSENGSAPITAWNLERAVKYIGDGYYALMDDLPKQKVYEEIATITVEADTDGSLPQYVIFSADSEGNAFELTDFYIEAHATFTDGASGTLFVDINDAAVTGNISSMSLNTTLRRFAIYFGEENSGCASLRVMSSTSGTLPNSQTAMCRQNILPPTYVDYVLPAKKIELYTATGTSKTWMAGSAFTLYGVRK